MPVQHKWAQLALAVLVLAVLASAQTATSTQTTATQSANVTSTDFWKGVARGVVGFMSLMLAAAFWGSLALLFMQ